jgi:hypothetical protein
LDAHASLRQRAHQVCCKQQASRHHRHNRQTTVGMCVVFAERLRECSHALGNRRRWYQYALDVVVKTRMRARCGVMHHWIVRAANCVSIGRSHRMNLREREKNR